MVLNPSRTVVQNLLDYYTAPAGGWRRRWQVLDESLHSLKRAVAAEP